MFLNADSTWTCLWTFHLLKIYKAIIVINWKWYISKSRDLFTTTCSWHFQFLRNKKIIMLWFLSINPEKSQPKNCTNWTYIIHLQLVICQGPVCQINLPALTKPFSNQPLQGILFGANPSKRQIYSPPQRWMTCQALPQFAYLCSPVKDSRFALKKVWIFSRHSI